MTKDQIQEACEEIALYTLNGGLLRGLVFRHDDSGQKAKTETISVKSGPPIPQLAGPRGFRVDVEITMRSATPQRLAALHGEAMRRILDPGLLRSGALSSGLTPNDDFYVLDEEISGDRSESKNIRKRTISVPFLVNSK